MTQDPFAQVEYLPLEPRRSRTWLYVAVILGMLFLFVTLLLVAGSLLALNHVGLIGTPDVPSTDGVASDLDGFTDGLGKQSVAIASSDEIRQWIESHADEPNGYISPEVPFDKKLFMQAVTQSPQATSLGFEARLSMVDWLDDYFPEPETMSYHSLISIERELDPVSNEPSNFAIANLYFYTDGFSEGMSSRWYLHKNPEGWKLYDFQRLELGRRTSDEWANYLSNLYSPDAEGYDDSKSNLNGVSYSDDPKSNIVKEEQRRVLPKDLSSKQLLIAQAYYRISEYADALRVLNTVNDPDLRWGILTTKSFVLSKMQRYDEAIAIAEELLSIAPNHPNGLHAMCNVRNEAKQDNELRTYLLRLLAVCPSNELATSRLLEIATPAELNDILKLKIQSSEPNTALESLLTPCFELESKFPAYLQDWREQRKNQPALPESFWQIIEVAETFVGGDTAAAVQSLHHIAAAHPESGARKILQNILINSASSAHDWCDPIRMSESDRLFTRYENPTLLTRFLAVENKLHIGAEIADSVSAIIVAIDSGAEKELEQWTYYDYYRAKHLAVSLLQLGYLDDAEKLIDCVSKSDPWRENTDVSQPQAGLLLYRNDIDSLTELLRGWESEDVNEWLHSEYVVKFLLGNPETAKRLLSEFTPDSPSDYLNTTADSVIVFNRSPTPPDEAVIRSWVEKVFHAPFSLTQVKTSTTDESKGLGTWKVSLDSGLELLVTISNAKFNEDHLDSDVLIGAMKSCSYIAVFESLALPSVTDAENPSDPDATQIPYATQKLVWELAVQSLGNNSLGLYCYRNSAFWVCDANSRETLRWGPQFPLRDQAIKSNYLEQLYEEAGLEDVTTDMYTEALQNGKTTVRVTFDATCATEIVEAELLSVNEETVQVQLKQSSQFAPLYQQGQKLNFSIYEIELAE